MAFILYGDGIHDDTAAIQEMIDNSCEVILPAPKAFYLISKTLILHSNMRLVLPRFAEIRLADGSNCLMLKSATVDDRAERITSRLFCHVNMYSPDFKTENISVEGGIWNYNNKGQNPNPLSCGKYEPYGYSGFIFLFYGVKNLKISSLTFKDPANFAVTMDRVSYFQVDDITFDYNDGNLYQSNMDGIHVCGNCNNGHISNLFGTCYDDIVALNAEEGSGGPIHDVTVNGIYTENSYSAVRLLGATPECSLKNIHISDIHGTFYHFVIALMQNYPTETHGVFENIVIDNVFASKSDRALVKFPLVFKYRRYGVIDIDGKIEVKNLRVSNVYREEYIDNIPTVLITENSVCHNVVLENIVNVNKTDKGDMPVYEAKTGVFNLNTKLLFADGKEVKLN